MEDGEDELNLAAARRAEQQGGNPLFRAEFQAIGSQRWWHGGAPNAERFRLTLRELRAPSDELLGEAMAEAYNQGLREVVRDRRYVPEEYLLKFVLHDNYYAHASCDAVNGLASWKSAVARVDGKISEAIEFRGRH